ncbi:hypothetical protein CJ179_37815 [Rhodococcus sp. ACS1]|nr:hypothetical protein [Rhodococcus sp. ACS1]PBC39139.1 hypothetical protein CJ179_37815 [Rhodococcus sp. ACS1]
MVFGLLSSIFDLATFGVLWWILHADTATDQAIFHTRLVVKGLLSQGLVVLVLRSRHGLRAAAPPGPVPAAVVTVIVAGLALPFLPVAHWTGLTPLPTVFSPVAGADPRHLPGDRPRPREQMGPHPAQLPVTYGCPTAV